MQGILISIKETFVPSRSEAERRRLIRCSAGPEWVKNGPDAIEMGCLYYRKQTWVSYAADCDLIACYGGAKPIPPIFAVLWRR
jgi:hypothetical protein